MNKNIDQKKLEKHQNFIKLIIAYKNLINEKNLYTFLYYTLSRRMW